MQRAVHTPPALQPERGRGRHVATRFYQPVWTPRRETSAVSLEPLSRQLKHGTKEVHAAAEKTAFVREFIKGRCPRWVYAAMLKDLYFVYAANQ